MESPLESYQNKTIICKICNSPAKHVVSYDANRCCGDRHGKRLLPVSDILVPYNTCQNCGFIFSNFMDEWNAADFSTRIYNSDYELLNPPLPGQQHVAPSDTPSYTQGNFIAAVFNGTQEEIRILDFGSGGNPGPTGQALIDRGFQVDSHDPFRADCPPPSGRYDLIVCTEVLEHCRDPMAEAELMKRHICRDGLVWIKTMVHPHPATPDALQSWYIAPRDGHVSIHTFWSLTLLFDTVGMRLAQTVTGMFAFREMTSFTRRIFPGA